MSRKRKPRAKTLNNGLTDVAQNLSLTTGGSFLSGYNTLAFSNNYSLVTLNRIILTYLYSGNGIFQTAIQLPIQDAIGKGIEIESGQLDNSDIDEIYNYWEEQGIWETVLNTWTWIRLFGGGALLINSAQDPKDPLSLRGLDKSELEFYDLDRWQLDTNIAVFDDWDSYIKAGDNNGLIYLYGEPIHESRLLRGQGKRAPHYIRRELRGWGMSEGERMIRDLNLYLKTQDATFELIDEAKIDVYKIDQLAQKMATNGGTSSITQRIQTANEIKNYVNALVLDAKEEYQQKQIAFAGLAEVMNQNREGVASALRMPMTKLFGLSSSGFNTGESDLENYNAMVESEIRAKMRPMIRQLLRVTMAHLFGGEYDFTFRFPTLRELTAEQEQSVKNDETNRILSIYDRGLMDSEEAMQSLRKAGVVQIETKAEKGILPPQPIMPQRPESTPSAVSYNSSETYKPPAGAASAARKAIKWKEKHGDAVKGGTQVGWTRARQLAKRENLSLETVKRMSSFFARHQGNQEVDSKYKDEPWKDAGYVAWLLWGGNAGKDWAQGISERNK